jgi:hypothetical protein
MTTPMTIAMVLTVVFFLFLLDRVNRALPDAPGLMKFIICSVAMLIWCGVAAFVAVVVFAPRT